VRNAPAISVVLALLLSLFGGTAALAVDPERQTRSSSAAVDDLRLDAPLTGVSATRPSTLDA
jgi:hypothetical protein